MKSTITKNDLIWIIPELIGSIAIAIIGAIHIDNIPPIAIIGLTEWIFQIALSGVVIKFGFKGVGHSTDELKRLRS